MRRPFRNTKTVHDFQIDKKKPNKQRTKQNYSVRDDCRPDEYFPSACIKSEKVGISFCIEKLIWMTEGEFTCISYTVHYTIIRCMRKGKLQMMLGSFLHYPE